MRVVVAGLVCVAAGCFAKPPFRDTASDAATDAPTDGSHDVAPEARLISRAYANSHTAMPHIASSAGMTGTTWEISAANVHPNDLVLFLANVDNGSDGVWLGLAPLGFTQLVQRFFSAGDGQTYVAAWKLATASEPALYSGTFGGGIESAAATITLIGVTGFDAALASPIGWTSQQVAYRVQSAVGSTGPISGTLSGSVKGTPWDVVLVVPHSMHDL